MKFFWSIWGPRPVINAGVRGYGLDQIVLRAERMIPEMKPSTVILAFITDDIWRTALSVRDFRDKSCFALDGEGRALRNVPVRRGAWSPLMMAARRTLGYSRLVDGIMTHLGAQEFWHGRELGTGVDPYAATCRLMDRFAALVKRERAHALVVAFEKENVGRDIDAHYSLWHFTDRSAAAPAIAAALAPGPSALPQTVVFCDNVTTGWCGGRKWRESEQRINGAGWAAATTDPERHLDDAW